MFMRQAAPCDGLLRIEAGPQWGKVQRELGIS